MHICLRLPENKNALSFPEAFQRALDGLLQRRLLRVPRPGDVDDGGVAKLAVADEAENLVDGPGLVGRVAVGPAAEPEADEADVLEDEQAGGQGDGLARHAAVGDEAGAGAEALGHGLGRLAADAVEAEPDALAPAARPLGDPVAELAALELLLSQDVVGAQGLELAAQVLGGLGGVAGAHHVDAAVAPEAAELDGGAADARVGAVLDEPVALAQGRVGKVAQHAVRRARVDGDGAGLRRREALLLDLEDAARLGRDVRPPRAEARLGRDHPIALINVAARPRYHLEHALVARYHRRLRRADQRRELWLHAVGALDRVHIRRVDGGGERPEEQRRRRERRAYGVRV